VRNRSSGFCGKPIEAWRSKNCAASTTSYYRWKKIYGNMEPSEAKELRQLRDENAKLKRIVADLSLDKAMLQDVLQKKF